jgi:hypothetical protein
LISITSAWVFAPCDFNTQQSLSILKGELFLPILYDQDESKMLNYILYKVSQFDFIPHYDESDLYGEVVFAIENMQRAKRNGYLNSQSLGLFKISWNKPPFWRGLKQWIKWHVKY